MSMDALIGNGGYGGGYGADIIGAQAPVGVPPYGYGFPAGTPFYPSNDYGWGAVSPFAALQMQQQMQQAQMQQAANGGAMTASDQVQAGLGYGGFPGCNVGPLTAPLAVQQVQQPLLGLAPRCMTRLETQYVGFQGCTIQPGQTAWITCQPCVLLKIIQWCIPSDIAYGLVVDQITVNGKDTLVNCGSVPAAMFVENSTMGQTINTQTIQPGCCIQIQVTNVSDAPIRFRAGALARVGW